MISVNDKDIDDMNVGELETAYIERLKARKGGMLMIWFTIPFLALALYFHVVIFVVIFGICMLFWVLGTLSIHYDLLEIWAKIKEIYGDDNE